MSNLVEVTFRVPKGRTHTHAGQPVKDGQKVKVSPRARERLAKRGVITAQPKAESKAEDKAKG